MFLLDTLIVMKRKNVVYKNLIYPLIFGLMFSTISCLKPDKNNEFVEAGVQNNMVGID